MRKNCLFSVIGCALVAVLLVCSCRREPLHDPQYGLYIKLNVILGPSTTLTGNVDIDGNPALKHKMDGVIPERVRACLYDVNTHQLVTEEFLPPTGGFVDVAAGVYDIIVYGLGTEATMVSATDTRAGSFAHTSFLGTRVKVMTRAGGVENVSEFPVINEPDHLFVGRATNVVVPVVSDKEDIKVVEIDMPTLLESYTFEVLNIFNAEKIRSMTVYITGQAPSRYLWDMRFPKSPCAITFDADVDEADGCIRTAFNTFGKFPDEYNQVFLNVQIEDVDGGRYQWIYDVTDQFDNPDNTGHKIVISDVIEIPDGGTGGFITDVNDWEAEIEIIPL